MTSPAAFRIGLNGGIPQGAAVLKLGGRMVSVDVLLTEVGRLAVPVARIDFYALPVQKVDDFVSVPPALISFADAQTISVALSQQILRGTVGQYDWRKSS
jgi:hypothetical protein